MDREAAETTWLDSMPEAYDTLLGPALFAPWAEYLAAELATRNPRRVLELAAGTGIVTAALTRRLPRAQITATDLNPAMVAWGAGKVEGARWQQADAQSLELPDRSFDAVVCQFGVMFFPDRPRAFAEMSRVLAPGGTVVFTTWDTAESSHFPDALVDSLAAALPDDPPTFVARVPHGYTDPDQIAADLIVGDLAAERIERVVLRGRAASARAIAEGFCRGTPLRFALAERGDLDALTEAVAEEMTQRLGDGPVEGDLAGYVVTASPRDG